MRRLRQLDEENRRLKSIVADQAVDLRVLKDVLAKKRLRPEVKRQMVREAIAEHHLSKRRACGLIGITRRAPDYEPEDDRNLKVRARLRELAEERRRWGCPMLYRVIRREAFLR